MSGMQNNPHNYNNYDLIVVGAGVIGAAFALKIAMQSNYRILVVERSEQQVTNDTPNQRVFALGKQATDLLDEIKVFSELDQTNCHAYQRMVVWDAGSKGELSFSAQDQQQSQLGNMVDATSLTLFLQRALQDEEQITAHYQLDIKSMHLHEEQATLNTTLGEFSAPLIVAADGGQSWCRQQAKIFAHRQSYFQQGIVARIKTAESHQDTAWQVFLNSGPLALLPLQDNECSIVWTANNDKVDDLLALNENEFANQLNDALQNRLGSVELLSARQSFPLQSVKAETYYKRRLALIGDAAHSIHPLAGQGANLGFKDVAALIKVLSPLQSKQFGDLTVLQSYQQARKADNEHTDLLMSSLNKIYQIDKGWLPTLRGTGMNIINSTPRFKNLLAKQAMGLL